MNSKSKPPFTNKTTQRGRIFHTAVFFAKFADVLVCGRFL